MARVAFDSLTGVTADVLLCIRWFELSPLSEMLGCIVSSLVGMAVFKLVSVRWYLHVVLAQPQRCTVWSGCSLAGRDVPIIGLDLLV
jgi:hypothetical protein